MPGGCSKHSDGRLSFPNPVGAMSLYHLVYQSQALAPFTDAELAALLLGWRDHNRQVHVTGLLLHSSDGRFLQILDGEDADVRQLYY